MLRLSELKLPLAALPVVRLRGADVAAESDDDRAPAGHPVDMLRQLVAQTLDIEAGAIEDLQVFKRSFDARKAELLAVYIVDIRIPPALERELLVRFEGHAHVSATPDMGYKLASQRLGEHAQRPVVVGFGPCGIFAALLLAQMGLRPLVIERGPMVRQRTRDTWDLWRRHQLHAESNVQFGEGGAGTFSDGKLWSQIRDPRHLGRKVMQELVLAGAPAEILYEAHPHVGTFKLVRVVENLRKQIIALGGEVRFQQRLVDVELDRSGDRQVLRGLRILDVPSGQTYEQQAGHVILALGHSARDTFAMLLERGLAMQAKPFSIGFRIEHPQSVIDRARWGRHAGHPLLGAADYRLVHHAANGRSVYSFCMCPGGTVVAAASEPGGVVTNGMSQYSRNERNANAGIVVGVDQTDFAADAKDWVQAFGEKAGPRLAAQANAAARSATHPLAGIVLQRRLEAGAFLLGGSDYQAPAQRVGDFLAARASSAAGTVQASYRPGVVFTDLGNSLPDYAIAALREAIPAFGKKIRGFDMADAVLTAVETRTSSPIRIDRDDSLQSVSIAGLFPAGEGAGYAGGIMSAAVDGIRVAEALAQSLREPVASSR